MEEPEYSRLSDDELMRLRAKIDQAITSVRKRLPPLLLWNDMNTWLNNAYMGQAPRLVRENVFAEFAIPDTPCIEINTHQGETTEFLANHCPAVHSIEPDVTLYDNARTTLQGHNITLYNDPVATALPRLLHTLTAPLNIWLNAATSDSSRPQSHFVLEPLNLLNDMLSCGTKIHLFIEGTRFFSPNAPSGNNALSADILPLDILVNYARTHNIMWRIEHDIFIMYTPLPNIY